MEKFLLYWKARALSKGEKKTQKPELRKSMAEIVSWTQVLRTALLQSQGFQGTMSSPGETSSRQRQELPPKFCLSRAFLGLSFNESSKRPALFSPQVQPNAKRTWRKKIKTSRSQKPPFSGDKQQQNLFFSCFFFFPHHLCSTVPQEVSRASCSKAEWSTNQTASFVNNQYHCFEPLQNHYTPG